VGQDLVDLPDLDVHVLDLVVDLLFGTVAYLWGLV